MTFSDIEPILGPACQWCHGWQPEGIGSGYDMESYDAIMDGTYRGGAHRPAIIPGDAENSPFIQFIEGRRKPRMPYKREPLAEETIALLRRWIDDGALPGATTSREHEIRLTDVAIAPGQSFWLSCRVPLENRHLRVKLVADSGRVLAYEWPTDGDDVDAYGKWDQWEIKVPASLPKDVTKASVVLLVSNRTSDEPEREDELSGTVFMLDSAKTPRAQLLRQRELKALATPTPPPHRQVEFNFVLRHASDVTLDIYPEKEERSLWRRTNINVPPHETVKVRWPINDRLRRGYYVARIRCRTRDTSRHQPSFAVLFHLNPPSNALGLR